MTYCEFCGEQIGYLPFSCKYCGGTFCKKHRLPENHECTFEIKHVSLVPIAKKETHSRRQDAVLKKSYSREYVDQGSKVIRKYLKRQDKENKKSLKQAKRYPRVTPTFKGAKTIIILIIALSVTATIFEAFGIGEYLLLSLNAMVSRFSFHTVFTSLFIDRMNPSDPFFFFTLILTFFMLYFTYIISRIVEMTNGTKFLVKLFLFSGTISVAFYFILRLALIPVYPISDPSSLFLDKVGLAWGGIFGLMSFSIFPSMNRSLTGMITFIPLRMKGKTLLLVLVLFRVIPAFLFGLDVPLVLLFYLPELGGILGSYIVYKFRIFKR
ncbi:MAG: AN1-type zinc finger protein [Promethearchaeota archaeon]|jgi:hypothetical protein